MMRIRPRKAGCEGRGPGWAPAGERQSRYCKSGSLDSRYSSRTGLTSHLVTPLSGLHLVPPPQSKLSMSSKGETEKVRRL